MPGHIECTQERRPPGQALERTHELSDRRHRLEREACDCRPQACHTLFELAGLRGVAAVINPIRQGEQHICSEWLHDVLKQVDALADQPNTLPDAANNNGPRRHEKREQIPGCMNGGACSPEHATIYKAPSCVVHVQFIIYCLLQANQTLGEQ